MGLPITLVHRAHPVLALSSLALASIVFYAHWDFVAGFWLALSLAVGLVFTVEVVSVTSSRHRWVVTLSFLVLVGLSCGISAAATVVGGCGCFNGAGIGSIISTLVAVCGFRHVWLGRRETSPSPNLADTPRLIDNSLQLDAVRDMSSASSSSLNSVQEVPSRGRKARCVRNLCCILAIVLLGAIGIGAAVEVISEVANFLKMGPPMGFLVPVARSGGSILDLQLHCVGSGAPIVVFESGLYPGILGWSQVLPALAMGRNATRVCAYNRAGYGLSSPAADSRTLDDMVSDFAALVETPTLNGAPPFVLVAHGVGGLIARTYMAKYPDKVAGAVLVDTPYHNIGNTRAVCGMSEEEFFGAEALFRSQLMRVLLPTGLVRFQAASGKPVARNECIEKLPSGLQSRAHHEILSVPFFNTVVLELEQFSRNLMATPNSMLNTTQLVVISRGMAINQCILKESIKMQRELAGLVPDSGFIIAENAGHSIQLEEPQVIVDAVRSVVESHRRSRQALYAVPLTLGPP